MENSSVPLAKQVNRVPSITVQLGPEQQARFDTLMEDLIMVDLHQHPMVWSDDMGDFIE